MGDHGRGEMVHGEDSSRARLGGEIGRLGATVDECLQTVVAQADVLISLLQSACGGGADSHAEALGMC